MKNGSNKPSMAVRVMCGILVGSLVLSAVVLVITLLL